MPRMRLASTAALLVLAAGSLMPDRAEAMIRIPASALNAADGIGMVEPAQFAPEQRQRTDYGELRARRLPQACHWERNYKTGISAWVCRTKENYGVAPRYPRVVPRYQEQRR